MPDQNDSVPRCEWCGKSVDGDPAADRGPGTTVLCFACRTLPGLSTPVPAHNTDRIAPVLRSVFGEDVFDMPNDGPLTWTHAIVSDGEEWFADGAPDNALHAFVFDGKDGHPVCWKVSDLRVDASGTDYEWGDEILAEGFTATATEAKAEAGAFIAGTGEEQNADSVLSPCCQRRTFVCTDHDGCEADFHVVCEACGNDVPERKNADSIPQTEDEARECIHHVLVWFGHECGTCMDQHGKFLWAQSADSVPITTTPEQANVQPWVSSLYDSLEQIGYLCIQDHPHRICSGCTSACCEPVFAYPEAGQNDGSNA